MGTRCWLLYSMRPAMHLAMRHAMHLASSSHVSCRGVVWCEVLERLSLVWGQLIFIITRELCLDMRRQTRATLIRLTFFRMVRTIIRSNSITHMGRITLARMRLGEVALACLRRGGFAMLRGC